MLKFLAKVYSAFIGFFAVLFMIIGGLIGYFCAPLILETLANEGINFPLSILVARIFFCILSVFGAFILDVFCFGYIAQLVEIKKNTEVIREKLDLMP